LFGQKWWNAYIAKIAMPDDQEDALRVIMKTADIRNNFIERFWIASRPSLAAGLIKGYEKKSLDHRKGKKLQGIHENSEQTWRRQGI